MPLTLAVITGSTRPGRLGPLVAEWAADFARENSEFEIAPLDLADFDLPLLDEAAHPSLKQYEHEHTKRWSAAIEAADAFLFVTPEYDYFAPASLVNAVQCLSQEWNYKVAGILSYGGVSAGLRSTQMLRLLLSNVGVHTVKDTAAIQFIKTHVNDGVFTAPEYAPEGLTNVLGELHKWSLAAAQLRS